MLKIIISGCSGHMGHAVASVASNDSSVSIVAGFDITDPYSSDGFPVYANPTDFPGKADVLIDFSVPSALDGLLKFGISRSIPLVLCTTGYSPEHISFIENASDHIPILRSGNMSLGINLLADLVWRACAVLHDNFDIEIVERHHRRKVDAPS